MSNQERMVMIVVTLKNGNTPPQPSLTEADTAKMEAFIDHVLLVLPAIRIDSFLQNIRPQQTSPLQSENQTIPRFELKTPKHNIHASARIENGDFIVETGSKARKEWSSSSHGYKNLMQNLIDTNILKPEENFLIFVQDYAFNSTSAAAAIVNGRPSNGRIEWKLEGTDKTYKEWEAE